MTIDYSVSWLLYSTLLLSIDDCSCNTWFFQVTTSQYLYVALSTHFCLTIRLFVCLSICLSVQRLMLDSNNGHKVRMGEYLYRLAICIAGVPIHHTGGSRLLESTHTFFIHHHNALAWASAEFFMGWGKVLIDGTRANEGAVSYRWHQP